MSCQKCDYEGNLEGEDREKTIEIFGRCIFTRSYGVLVCPECGHEEKLYKI